MTQSCSTACPDTDAPAQSTREGSGADVWVVIPAFNEGPRIEKTLRDLLEHFSGTIVVVDDASVDSTASQVAQFPVWLLRHPINCGQGAALQTGIHFALQEGANVVVTFDADGQHEGLEIAGLVAPVVAGKCDVALGSRFLGSTTGIPLTRWLLLKLAIIFTRLTSRIRLTDVHNGFRAFSRHAAELIQIRQSRMAHASEILDEISRHGLRFLEVPVTVTYRPETLRKGQSSLAALRITGELLLGRFSR